MTDAINTILALGIGGIIGAALYTAVWAIGNWRNRK